MRVLAPTHDTTCWLFCCISILRHMMISSTCSNNEEVPWCLLPYSVLHTYLGGWWNVCFAAQSQRLLPRQPPPAKLNRSLFIAASISAQEDVYKVWLAIHELRIRIYVLHTLLGGRCMFCFPIKTNAYSQGNPPWQIWTEPSPTLLL